MFIKNTISFCPTCYKRIPASILLEDKVYMHKKCSEHGETVSLVESDNDFYLKCLSSGSNNIYNGYFLDVTNRCNLKCKYCFYGVENTKDPSIETIKQEVYLHKGIAPIIISGGEPSLRKDLNELITEITKITPNIELLTNGTGIVDSFDQTSELLKINNGITRINLSMHKESNGKDFEIIEKSRKLGVKLESVLFVIDDLTQINDIIKFGNKNSDVIESIRIKAATRLWAEQKPEDTIFVSDMLNYISKRYDYKPIWWRNNKTSFFNLQIGKIFYMLVSWYNVNNIDIVDINCPPYYMAKTGQIENIVTANIINEGLSKGWMNGKEINHG